MVLANAKVGSYYKILSIDDEELSIKLYELGFSLEGNLRVNRKAPAGGPLSLSNHKTQIILRREDARKITIKEASSWK